ncbi:hypothetical protein GQ42DRAFT_164044 [Ramicandelaber brevisporus]|nr:hypothetical protein GQ42DRAFT_164044 [Ramicandelaber brevisporus]
MKVIAVLGFAALAAAAAIAPTPKTFADCLTSCGTTYTTCLTRTQKTDGCADPYNSCVVHCQAENKVSGTLRR